jgi:hypothetical protein
LCSGNYFVEYKTICQKFKKLFGYGLFSHGSIVLVGPRAPPVDISRSYSETPQSVGLLWTSDQLIAETSVCQHTTFPRHKHPSPLAEFEPTILGSKWPQTHVLDSATTEIGSALALMITDEFVRPTQQMKSGTERCHINVTVHVAWNTACAATIKCTLMAQNFR